ncbi:MAG TPA: hypothetical protein VFP31_12255 [Gaiellaceae bacterium]|nr:hypothetical protein [Gaiellaceae bacterium]
MAVDVAVSSADAPARPRPIPVGRVAAVPAGWLLAGLVGLSFAVRWLVAAVHTTPVYFPDEYIYSAIARSLADGDGIAIRGHAASFPALLQPILNAPFWIFEEPAVAYRLTQGLNALAMSLAAVPVYLIARRLQLSERLALGCAVLAVVTPNLFYVSYVLGEPIAYPLVLGAVYFGIRAISQPTPGVQLGLVACSGLAAFARVQFVVLPVVFLLAAALADVRVLKRLRLTLLLFALPLLGALALGPMRVLGYYSRIANLDVHPLEMAGWGATDLMLLAYSSGWILVPGAVAGLAYALCRPKSRAEKAFAALAVLLVGALLVEATLYAANAAEAAGGGRFQERYLMTILPLVAPAFCLWLKRGAPARWFVAVSSLALLLVSARVPLSAYTSDTGRQDSPFLLALYWVEKRIGYDNGSLALAAAVAVLSLLAAGLAFRPRRAAPLGLGAAILLAGTASAGAVAFDADNVPKVRGSYLPADARWVDHADVGPVTYLQTPGGPRELAFSQLFWNRSIGDVVRLPHGNKIDAFHQPLVRIADDGSLVQGGRPIRTAILIPRYSVFARFRNATRVAATPTFDLWRADGTPQLDVLVAGRFYDGWLANDGWIEVRSTTGGTLRLPVTLPENAPKLRVRFTGSERRTVVLEPGEKRTLAFDVPAGAVWRVDFDSNSGAYLPDFRHVSVHSGTPTFSGR